MKDYRRYHCDENKLTDYGFKKQGHNYIYKKDILDGDFRIEVIINSILDAKVYDTDTDEEYTNIHLVGKQGKFVQKVRTAYEDCIEDILNHCFVYDYFIFPQSKRYQTGVLRCANGDFSCDLCGKIRIFRCVRVVFGDFVIMVLSLLLRLY